MVAISDLQPTQRRLVFDLVEEAGYDVSGWIKSSNDPRGPKANPAYCYEWAFVEPGKLIVLNFWHSDIKDEDGRIVQRKNFRDDAEYHRSVTRKTTWAKRAQRVDEALQTAWKENLPVRVIINTGNQRTRDDPGLRPSEVRARELDTEPWTIADYEIGTGRLLLVRGTLGPKYVDQFDLDVALKTETRRIEVATTSFIRDPAVRRRVLSRSMGICELCKRPGFEMASGAVYLETHHIIPLALGGSDSDTNVVALCADDHRRAHFGIDRDSIASHLLAIARR
ncbi:HNH endonuclease [Sandarakinorhabdus sp.]|uniref:HNH endonuclease n=1 Tax=Sandarakinorhabdus sp. TaxID=1916663 RepID=UPI003F72D09A